MNACRDGCPRRSQVRRPQVHGDRRRHKRKGWRLTADLGPKPIHMRTLRKGDRRAVMGRVKFDGTEIAGFCIHLEKQRAPSKVLDHFKRKGKYDYTNRRKLSRTHSALLWQMIREPLEGFLLQHGHAARDLVFQCDADCRDFANDQGWMAPRKPRPRALAGRHPGLGKQPWTGAYRNHEPRHRRPP